VQTASGQGITQQEKALKKALEKASRKSLEKSLRWWKTSFKASKSFKR
jgi:hypothetical protein